MMCVEQTLGEDLCVYVRVDKLTFSGRTLGELNRDEGLLGQVVLERWTPGAVSVIRDLQEEGVFDGRSYHIVVHSAAQTLICFLNISTNTHIIYLMPSTQNIYYSGKEQYVNI